MYTLARIIHLHDMGFFFISSLNMKYVDQVQSKHYLLDIVVTSDWNTFIDHATPYT